MIFSFLEIAKITYKILKINVAHHLIIFSLDVQDCKQFYHLVDYTFLKRRIFMENKNDSSIETNAYKKLNFFLKQIRTKTDFVPE